MYKMKFINAEDYILQIFKNHNIIGLGEGGHHLENAHQFFQNLFDNKKIQEVIDFVIVEFANANYQTILDKYIFGEQIYIEEIKKIWRESTQSPGLFGEAPIYFDLLKKIRNINSTLPNDKKIKVLAGDPSIDWKSIHTLDDYKKQIGYNREVFPAELAIDFGVMQRKKVLVIYSEFHLTKIADNTLAPTRPTITSIVDKKHSGAMKVIGTIYSESFLSEEQFRELPLYSVIELSNNELGNISAHKFFPGSLYKDGKELIAFDGYKIKELFDALLYVGQYASLKRYPMPKPNFDNDYLCELNRRRKIVGMKPF